MDGTSLVYATVGMKVQVFRLTFAMLFGSYLPVGAQILTLKAT
jgi:hypothetical protein